MNNKRNVVLSIEDVEHIIRESLIIIDKIYKGNDNEELFNHLGLSESEFDKIVCGDFEIDRG